MNEWVGIVNRIRQTRHAGHCGRSEDELICDIFLGIPTHECTCVGWAVKNYIHQLCLDTRCCLEDLPRVMTQRDR